MSYSDYIQSIKFSLLNLNESFTLKQTNYHDQFGLNVLNSRFFQFYLFYVILYIFYIFIYIDFQK